MSALLVGALSGPAFSQSLQVIYSPYAAAPGQPVYVAQQAQAQPYQQPYQQYPAQQYYVYPAQPPQPRYVSQQAPVAQPRYAVPQPQPAPRPQYAAAVQPAPAPPPPAPADSGRGFFSQIFGGPTIQVPVTRLFSNAPVPPQQYQPGPVAPEPAVLTPASYPPAAGRAPDMSSYPIDPKFDRQVVAFSGEQEPGTIVVDTPNKFLYLVEDGGRALRYGIGVGRPGFTWSGVHTITAKKEWPDWTPPPEMLERRPDLPRFMPGGMDNPLGARALYLGSTLYRIHGSNEPWTIGTNVSSGCIRMRNADVEDLYNRVKVGTKVVVM